jgi:hypothetical protein
VKEGGREERMKGGKEGRKTLPVLLPVQITKNIHTISSCDPKA